MLDDPILAASAGVLGGIGIFLLAISLLTQGLQMISGNALRSILARWTKSPLRGIALGTGVTALLQSSSAVTAITIGLVNASIVPLVGAIWVIFGANVGTTMTGWLISLTGFDFDIKAFALPILGLGMLMKTFSWRWQMSAIGTALTGFGLFFVGIDILKDAFSIFASNSDFASITQTGFLSLLALLGAGFAMTVMTQSSSAATALILTGTAGGMLTLSGGAAMIIGANLGTTSTAVLAVMGASSNAKRAAAAHVMFNGFTAIAAIILLPLLLTIVAWLEKLLEIPPTPIVSLAMFHTVFNVTGVLFLSPFVPTMSRFLEKRFISTVERDGKPAFLDAMSLNMPALAVDALIQELARFKTLACQNALSAFSGSLNGKADHTQQEKRNALSALSSHIANFTGNLAREKTPADISARLSAALRVNRYLREVSLLSIHARNTRLLLRSLKNADSVRVAESFLEKSSIILTNLSQNVSLSETVLTDFISEYHQTKEYFLEAGALRKITIEELSALLDHLSALRRMIEQAIKANRNLAILQTA